MLKEYVWNRASTEGSIVEGYVVNEALTFCFKYLKGVETKFNRPKRNPNLTDDSKRAQLLVFKSIGRPIEKGLIVQLKKKRGLQNGTF